MNSSASPTTTPNPSTVETAPRTASKRTQFAGSHSMTFRPPTNWRRPERSRRFWRHGARHIALSRSRPRFQTARRSGWAAIRTPLRAGRFRGKLVRAASAESGSAASPPPVPPAGRWCRHTRHGGLAAEPGIQVGRASPAALTLTVSTRDAAFRASATAIRTDPSAHAEPLETVGQVCRNCRECANGTATGFRSDRHGEPRARRRWQGSRWAVRHLEAPHGVQAARAGPTLRDRRMSAHKTQSILLQSSRMPTTPLLRPDVGRATA